MVCTTNGLVQNMALSSFINKSDEVVLTETANLSNKVNNVFFNIRYLLKPYIQMCLSKDYSCSVQMLVSEHDTSWCEYFAEPLCRCVRRCVRSVRIVNLYSALSGMWWSLSVWYSGHLINCGDRTAIYLLKL